MLIRSLLAAGFTVALVFPPGAQTAAAAAGGTVQRNTLEACTGVWLFNGVWRVKVLSVNPAASYNDGSQTTGVGVKLQVRNGTSSTIAPNETGFSDVSGHGIDLAYADENTVNAVGAGTGLSSQLMDKKLPPGGAATVIVYFPYGADKAAKPATLLIAVDPRKNRSKARYTVKNPGFRVHLNCENAN